MGAFNPLINQLSGETNIVVTGRNHYKVTVYTDTARINKSCCGGPESSSSDDEKSYVLKRELFKEKVAESCCDECKCNDNARFLRTKHNKVSLVKKASNLTAVV